MLIRPNVPKHEDRKKFIEALKKYLSINEDTDSTDAESANSENKLAAPNSAESLIKILNDALGSIDFYGDEDKNKYFLLQQVQLGGVIALEAEFFKVILEESDKEQYKDLHESLFGAKSEFKKIYDDNKQKEHNNVLDYADLDITKTKDSFANKLQFANNLKDFFKSKSAIEIQNADKKSIESFLLNVDPRLMSYAVVLGQDKFSIEFQNDMYKAQIETAYLFIMTGLGLVGPALIAGGTGALLVHSLPIAASHLGLIEATSIGLALLMFCYQVDPKSVTGNPQLQNRVNQGVDGLLEDKSQATSNLHVAQAINLVNVIPKISPYATKLWKQNQTKYHKNTVDQEMNSLQALFQSRYTISKGTLLHKIEDLSVVDEKFFSEAFKAMHYLKITKKLSPSDGIRNI